MDKNVASGFTLLELISTLMIIALLVIIGVPALQAMIRNHHIALNTNEFLGAINFARGEAIKRGGHIRVVLCPGSVTGCLGTAWGNGWIAFVDVNNSARWETGEQILRVYERLSGNDTLSGNNNVKNYISFSADGSARLISGAFQAGTLTFGLCNTNKRKNTIVINSIGRARVVPVNCS